MSRIGNADSREESEAGKRVERGCEWRDIVRSPEIGEIGAESVVVREDETEEDQAGE